MVDVTRTFEDLGDYTEVVESTLAQLDAQGVVSRIWQGDHGVWAEDPTEIADRLGWLTLPASMQEEIPLLQAFASEVRAAGFKQVVLLGMGGSSLGPEVFRRTLGSQPGYPELLVLDSTLPAWIQAVDKVIDPSMTLFLVSSKSGTTIESNTLYAYFYQQVAKAVGEEAAGGNFVAVTDPGTALESLAEQKGFRRVFANPPNIGGRYSVLSYFGMVPAALIGGGFGHPAGPGRVYARELRRYPSRQKFRRAIGGHHGFPGPSGKGQANPGYFSIAGEFRAVGGAAVSGKPGQVGQGHHPGGRRVAPGDGLLQPGPADSLFAVEGRRQHGHRFTGGQPGGCAPRRAAGAG